MVLRPSVTSKRTARLSPRCTLPSFTRPPMRMRCPALTCFSTTSVGELKNTIESLSATSTSATASASTPSAAPSRERRRCLRVITFSERSAFDPQSFDQVVEPPQFVRIAGERTPRIRRGGARLVGLPEHHIGANEPQPPLNVGAVAVEPLCEAIDHTLDHELALFRAELRRCGDLLLARAAAGTAARDRRTGPTGALDAGERAAHEIDPGRARRSGLDQRAPRRSGADAVAVLLGRQTEEVARLHVRRVERDGFLECALRF